MIILVHFAGVFWAFLDYFTIYILVIAGRVVDGKQQLGKMNKQQLIAQYLYPKGASHWQRAKVRQGSTISIQSYVH